MASYRDRVTADLDAWIAAGHIGADKRDAILATLPQARRLDAASALAWVGAVLLGVAVIAFIAANWSEIPRLGRFAMVIGLFAASAGAAAWYAHRNLQRAADALLMFASLVFAAAIGLTGQIFDIAGEPRNALYGAGVAAFALSLAGRSQGAAIVGLLFLGIADFMTNGWGSGDLEAPWLIFAAPLGAWLAIAWKSAPLAHASAIAIIASFGWVSGRIDENHQIAFLFFSVWLAAMAAGGRWLRQQNRPFGGVFYGWFAWGALFFFAIGGYAGGDWGILHRLVWLLAAGGLIALGRYDQHNMVTTIGVLGLMGAIAALLSDLGLNLLAAAGLFFVAALAALIIGLALRRRGNAEAKS